MFRPESEQPDFARLLTQLAQIKRQDNALYQVLKQLITANRQSQEIFIQKFDDADVNISEVTNLFEILDGQGYPAQLGHASL